MQSDTFHFSDSNGGQYSFQFRLKKDYPYCETISRSSADLRGWIQITGKIEKDRLTSIWNRPFFADSTVEWYDDVSGCIKTHIELRHYIESFVHNLLFL